jgi:HlyD family secretion protein
MGEKLSKFIAIIKKRRTPLVLVLLLGGVILVAAFLWGNKTSASDYITAKVERTSLEVDVSATGTVQAVITVQVGSQVSGTVAWLGADFNSQVKRGEVIAKLDPAIFQTQVDNASANVINAEAAVNAAATEINNQKANIQAAKANQEVNRVQRDDAFALVKRYQELQSVVPGRDIEAQQAVANAAAARYQQAGAQVAQAEAALQAATAKLDQARASLAQSKAQLQQSKVNLEHSIISSPIDGVVVSRNVDVGQTVAASLQAPTLFTIANDLTKMQVLASIDEADVGQIKQGIKANFTVDAYPGETFSGEISQLRLNAQTLQNVVTYNAVIDVSNEALKLRPGMTANITIPVAHRENVLAVPNAALRFKPNLSEKEQQELQQKMEQLRKEREARAGGQGNSNQGAQGSEASQESANRPGGKEGAASSEGENSGRRGGGQGAGGQGTGGQGQDGQRRPGGEGGSFSGARGPGGPGQAGQRRGGQTVWVLAADKKLEPRFVRTGLTNGRSTEIIAGNLHEGDTIVIGQNEPSSSRTQQSGSPLNQRPPMGRGR